MGKMSDRQFKEKYEQHKLDLEEFGFVAPTEWLPFPKFQPGKGQKYLPFLVIIKKPDEIVIKLVSFWGMTRKLNRWVDTLGIIDGVIAFCSVEHSFGNVIKYFNADPEGDKKEQNGR